MCEQKHCHYSVHIFKNLLCIFLLILLLTLLLSLVIFVAFYFYLEPFIFKDFSLRSTALLPFICVYVCLYCREI